MALSSLSGDAKDALILSQQATIEELRATVAEQQTMIMELRETIAQLETKLAANSSNSNRPPSSDGLKKGPPKPHSLRQRTGKKPGGQPGHPGTAMAWAENPDKIVVHAPPSVCDVCNVPLPEPKIFASRQVFDLPEIRYDVTEHHVLESQCLCGKLHRGVFPDGVDAPMQYGPQVKGLAVYLTQQQMLPLQRCSELIRDLFDLSFCKGSVSQANIEAAALLTPVVDMIADALRSAPVAHADETGMRVEAKLHWMHTLVTPLLTWIGVHRRRGAEAMKHFNILPHFRGTLVHDGWESYRGFKDCIHSLCNAHHLRELKALAEDHGQLWAQQMGKMLQEACHEVNVSADGRLTQERIAHYRLLYNKILRTGEKKHPACAPSGKRGRTKQSSATNLLRRLREHTDEVWRFAVDPEVPFTNNLAEQAIRMPKVKQKISGSFRTKEGAERFCTIRSYLETLRKQDHHLLDALTLVFQGNVPQPRLP